MRTLHAVPAVLLLVAAACGQTHPVSAPAPAPASTPASPAPSPPRLRPAAQPAIDPLTGLAVARAVLARPALSVKIDNVPQARPQAGLDQAEMVTEELVEGGLTRFIATFDANSAPLLGPVRSARPVDAAILRALGGGVFAFSGAAAGEIAPSIAYSHAYFLDHDADPVPYFLEPGRSAPQNVFTSTARLRAEAARLRYTPSPARRIFDFSPRPTAGATPVGAALIHLSGYSTAGWTWNAATDTWLRSEDGTPHYAADGVRLAATDVVILSVAVTHSGITDAAGNEDPFVLATGSGSMVVLRQGVAERGHWSRPSVADPFRFTAPGGGPVPLAPGNVWLELMPLGGPFPTQGSLQLS